MSFLCLYIYDLYKIKKQENIILERKDKMTKSIYTFGKDRLEVDVSNWLDKYSIRLNDKLIHKEKIAARSCKAHIHEINIGDRIFRIRFIADIFGIMSPVIEPITSTIDTSNLNKEITNSSGTNIGVWMFVILLVIIITVLPIIPKENCIQILGHNVSCTTQHVSIIQLILNR